MIDWQEQTLAKQQGLSIVRRNLEGCLRQVSGLKEYGLHIMPYNLDKFACRNKSNTDKNT